MKNSFFKNPPDLPDRISFYWVVLGNQALLFRRYHYKDVVMESLVAAMSPGRS